MDLIYVGTLCVSFAVLIMVLAVITVGIWVQERTGSLAQEPPGLCVSVARRLLGLHVRYAGASSPQASGDGHD